MHSWTGIYVWKNEEHQDLLYCGVGEWAFNPKKKGELKKWGVETWTSKDEHVVLSTIYLLNFHLYRPKEKEIQ